MEELAGASVLQEGCTAISGAHTNGCDREQCEGSTSDGHTAVVQHRPQADHRGAGNKADNGYRLRHNCAAIKLCDGGPVFFRQERLTQDGRVFRIIKFRSMVVNAEKEGQRLASEHDDRITPVGKVIRRLRIDELPQFFNVLKGDMSLVGPRPECPSIAKEYEKWLPDFAYRLKVKAGITGYAQVYGNYATHPADKLMMDIMYIEKSYIVLDINLILLTARALFMTDKTKGKTEKQKIADADNEAKT